MADDPRGVFFDLVGTLIRSRRPIGEQYAAWARLHGAPADPDRMGAAFRHAMRGAPPMAFPAARNVAGVAAAERQWWNELVRRVVDESGVGDVLQGQRFDAFFADLYRHFTTADAWETYPDALPTLKELSGRGLVVGLITNYDTRVYSVLDALDLSSWLDSVTIPALAGTAKPDAAIFRHALDGHGLAPASAIYVGDDPGDDYEGSEGAGMSAVLIDREGTYEAAGLRTIRTLAELVV